jgi:hypothetical protein
MGRQPNSGASPHTQSLTSPRSHNGGTSHDETRVEANELKSPRSHNVVRVRTLWVE